MEEAFNTFVQMAKGNNDENINTQIESFELNVLHFDRPSDSGISESSNSSSFDSEFPTLQALNSVDLGDTDESDQRKDFETANEGSSEHSLSEWEVLDILNNEKKESKNDTYIPIESGIKESSTISLNLSTSKSLRKGNGSYPTAKTIGSLYPSSLGRGLILEIHEGEKIEISKKEAETFQYYFCLADSSSKGVIDLEEGIHFLRRSDVDVEVLLKDWEIARKATRSPVHFSLAPWFLICKLVALEQSLGSGDLKLLTSSSPDIEMLQRPLPNFHLLGPPRRLDLGSFYIKLKMGGDKTVANHTEYELKSQTNIPSYFKKEVLVWRRFRDFVWLHDTLQQHFCGRILPPLPNKKWFGRKKEGYIASRKLGLRKYLHTLCHHPVICGSFVLQCFLEAGPKAFEAAKHLMKEGGTLENELLEPLTDLHRIFCCAAAIQCQDYGVDDDQPLNEHVLVLDNSKVRHTPEEEKKAAHEKKLRKIKEFIHKFHPDISKAEREHSKFLNLYGEQVQIINKIGESFVQSESDHMHRQRIAVSFGRTANVLEAFLANYKSNIEGLVQQRGYADSIISALNSQQNQMHKFQSACNDQKAFQEKMRRKGIEEKSSTEFRNLQSHISRTERRQSFSAAQAVQIVNNIWEDFEWFSGQRAELMKNFITDHLKCQITQAEAMRNAWKSMLEELKFTDEEIIESRQRLQIMTQTNDNEHTCYNTSNTIYSTENIKSSHSKKTSNNLKGSSSLSETDKRTTVLPNNSIPVYDEKEQFERLKRLFKRTLQKRMGRAK